EAAERVADAIQNVGVDRWPRFLANLERHVDPAEAMDPQGTEPVPFVDDEGRQQFNWTGKPIMRPAGMDPHFFASQRAKDREWVETLLSSRGEGGPEAATAILMRHLSKFNRGAAWDAQRIGGAYRPEFVDYATVAIGLYAAAAGISRGISLHVQNLFAITSHFASDADMGSRFRNLLVRSSILALVLGTGLFLVHSVLDWFRSDCSITVVQHLPSPDGAKEAFVKDWFCEGPDGHQRHGRGVLGFKTERPGCRARNSALGDRHGRCDGRSAGYSLGHIFHAACYRTSTLATQGRHQTC
ncbi:MAG TPA: hypothetical protein VE690_20070, partial [Rhodopila sp.]|nr:hypothetical protein [Rhodopila sp.]